MAEARRDAERSPQSRPPRQHGLLYNLVWGWADVICAGMVPHMNPALFITMRKSLLNRRYIFPVFSIFPGRRPCTRIC